MHLLFSYSSSLLGSPYFVEKALEEKANTGQSWLREGFLWKWSLEPQNLPILPLPLFPKARQSSLPREGPLDFRKGSQQPSAYDTG